MLIQNDLSSLMQTFQQEKERQKIKNDTSIDREVQNIIAKAGDIEDEETKRENFGLKSFELMGEKDYDAFVRATEGLDDASIQRYASSLHFFTLSYTNLLNNPQNSMLNSDNQSLESLMNDSFMLQVSEFSIKEGAKVLKKSVGSENGDIMGFLNRFQNALLADQIIEKDTRI